MQPLATPSLLARLTGRRVRPPRPMEPADMGTAFGMEQWLDERDHPTGRPRAAVGQRKSWLPRWLQGAPSR